MKITMAEDRAIWHESIREKAASSYEWSHHHHYTEGRPIALV